MKDLGKISGHPVKIVYFAVAGVVAVKFHVRCPQACGGHWTHRDPDYFGCLKGSRVDLTGRIWKCSVFLVRSASRQHLHGYHWRVGLMHARYIHIFI